MGAMPSRVVAMIAVALFTCGGALLAQQQKAPPPVPPEQNVVGGLLAQQAGRRGNTPPAPAPRNAAGRVLLHGATPKERGVWLPGPGITAVPILPPEKVPFQRWARKVFEDRLINEFEPHTRCKPSGLARAFQTPYGVEFVELPELRRIYIFDIGGPHTFKTIYMDGRSHPKTPTPTAYGHSIGWWEGDTLVVDSLGFNERFWLERKGLPHTDRLHTVERFTRVNHNEMRYEITIDDPGAYTETWTTSVVLTWEPDTELFEYVCQQANYATSLMVGSYETIDRTSPIVP